MQAYLELSQTPQIEPAAVKLFIRALQTSGGYDFSEYSEKSFARRIEKIMIDNRMDIFTLINKVKVDPIFMENVVKNITVNTTELFRDPNMWQTLRYRVFPHLANKSKIRIWHAGCSIGLEVYSMEILLKELGLFDKTEIYASDINSDVIEVARKGIYNYKINIDFLDNFEKALNHNPYDFSQKLHADYNKYLTLDKDKNTISINGELLGKAFFRKHDLVRDPNPFNVPYYDLILCRNVLIYFNADLQNKVIMKFHSYLDKEGYLVLGIHESILGNPTLNFTKKGLFYQKNNNLY